MSSKLMFSFYIQFIIHSITMLLTKHPSNLLLDTEHITLITHSITSNLHPVNIRLVLSLSIIEHFNSFVKVHRFTESKARHIYTIYLYTVFTLYLKIHAAS